MDLFAILKFFYILQFLTKVIIAHIDITELPEKEQKKRQKLMTIHGFDAYLSDKLIPLNRTLPDFRSEWCKSEYRFAENSVSIIICFHNEV